MPTSTWNFPAAALLLLVTHAYGQQAFDWDQYSVLNRKLVPGVLNPAGDVRALPLRAGSVDRIIVQHVIHHLTSDLLAENLRNVRAALAESARVLAPGGRLFIIDSTTTRFFDLLQRVVYTISYHALKILGKPMCFMFSARALARMCRCRKALIGIADDKDIVVH